MSDFQSLKKARKQRAGQAPFVSRTALANAPENGGTKNTGSFEEEMKIDREDQAMETANSSTSEVLDGSSPATSSLDGLYRALPLTLEIRMTKETGRGLYSTTNYRPGMLALP